MNVKKMVKIHIYWLLINILFCDSILLVQVLTLLTAN